MAELKVEEVRTGMEIAVIGMAGRFPGAKHIDEFWNNLKQGVESISFFSHQELKESGISPEVLETPGYIKVKGALENIEDFDAVFFEYTAKEAEIMDPQLRILHESCWKALENAGHDPWSYKGLIGLYAGAGNNHHWLSRFLSRMIENRMGENELFEIGSLNSNSSFCTRISYKLNLKGPSIFIQTACSTSLVAIHLACQGLLAGECDMALAGGVSISIPQKSGYLYQEGMLHSLKGHVRTFDAKADGTVFGNGVGIVVLKPLEEAITEGDTIHALVKGTAVNNDGFWKVGFTAPGTKGQAAVIRRAFQAAEVEPESISYIEAHGTGTTLGDPIEIEALKLAFKTNKTGFCKIGSVKPNIGHLDAAAGVAGFIKTVLALTHRMIPPNLNFESPNPEIDFENSPFYLNTTLNEWKNDKYPLRAGVSSFGIGGTNAHAVLEESPVVSKSVNQWAGESVRKETAGREYQLILLSARTESALDKMTNNLEEYFIKSILNHGNHENPINPGQILADAAYTLQVGRKAFEWRRMWVCPNTGPDVAEAVEALTPGDSQPPTTFVPKKNENKPVIFMFPGQGAQYVNMGLDLYNTEPVFREQMDRCFKIIKPIMGYDIKEILYPSLPVSPGAPVAKNRIDQTEIAQPLLFIFEYALSKLLIKWGIKPYAMMGHSIGEYTAACLTGVFSLEDALTTVALRGKLMQRLPGGAMLSISLPEEELIPLLTEETSLAAVNGPESCTVSGTYEAIDVLTKELEEKEANYRRLHTSHAFHSQMMAPILKKFAGKVKEIKFNQPGIPYISNLTGDWITVGEAGNPGYWAKHLRETVRFSEGVQELLKKEEDFIFVEVGPGKTLSTFVNQHKKTRKNQWVVNLIKHPKEDVTDDYYLLNKIGQLWLHGVFADWKKFYAGEKRRRIPLPTYPFEGQRFRFEENLIPMGKIVKETVDSIERERPEPLHKRPGLSTVYTPPSNEIEQKLADIWQKFFGVDQAGIYDDFFELGGDSLKISIIISNIHKEFHVEVPLEEFFRGPTIAGLASFIEDKVGKDIFSSIKPGEEKGYYPLSSAQRRLYILKDMDDLGTGYNIPHISELEGKINEAGLEDIFRRLIKRHESLRTSFHMMVAGPVQKIHRENYKFRMTNPQSQIANENLQIDDIIKNFIRPFDLSQTPLLRVGLITESQNKHILMVDIHHIISDGISMSVLIREFLTLYKGDALSRPRIQYKDFSKWQGSRPVKETIKKQEEYWLKELQGEIPVVDLPADFARPGVRDFAGGRCCFEISREETKSLKEYAPSKGTTLFMVLLAIYNIFLSKISRQEEIVVGTPEAGRGHSDLEDIVGMFVNTLVLRNFPGGDKHFHQFLEEVKERTLKAFSNRDYPYEELVEKVPVTRDTSRNPLFDTMFILQNYDMPVMEVPGLTLKPYMYDQGISRFDLVLQCLETGNNLRCHLDFSTKLFKRTTIRRFIKYFKKVISTVTRDPAVKILDIEIISEEEKKSVLHDFNDTGIDYPGEKTLHQLFAEQGEKTPGNIAVVGCRFENILHTTYKELNKKSNQLGRSLRERGVEPGIIVGITASRSQETIIGILAILKAGGAYLPLAPDYPGERINFMLKDSSAKILLTSPGTQVKVKRESIELIDILDLLSSSPLTLTSTRRVSPPNLAYTIYTSGTTGKPKGVMVEHRNAVNVVCWFGSSYLKQNTAHVLMMSDYTFDPSVNQVFGTLLHGGVLFNVQKELIMNHKALRQYIDRHQIHVINFVPTLLNELLAEGKRLESIRAVLSGGERLDDTIKNNIIEKGYALYNQYGPTETTIDALVEKCSKEKVTLGKPIANTRCYIIDKYNHPVPMGIAGELYVGGDGVSRGYLNQPQLTFEKFINYKLHITNSKTQIQNKRMPPGQILSGPGEVLPQSPNNLSLHYPIYMTGDLARWLPDGKIEFLGRIDQQLKIRGYRIELEEIQHQLLRHKSVKETIVTSSEDSNGDKYLCAYVVTDMKLTGLELREFLFLRLPGYMIPDYFLLLEKIPLTPSGKVDRKALPAPGTGAQLEGMDHSRTRYTPPGNKIQEKLAEIWANILQLDKKTVDINANFFEMGGNSLKMIRLNAAVGEEFNLEINFRNFIRHSTVAQLARFISVQQTANGKTHYPGVSPDPGHLNKPFPLTEIQLAYLLGRSGQIEMGGVSTHAYLEFSTRLEISRLNKSLNRIIRRHPMMMAIIQGDGQQRILETVPGYRIAVEDLSQLAPGKQKSRLEKERQRMSHYIFKPDQWPLFEIKAFKLQGGASPLNHLCIGFDPLFTDAFSTRIIAGELGLIYANPDLELPPLEFTFRDYLMACRQLKASEVYKRDKEYWLGKLEDFPMAPALPLKCNPAEVKKPHFKRHRKIFPAETWKTLQERAGDNHITPVALLCTVYARVLAYWSNQPRLAINLTVFNRYPFHKDIDKIVGDFTSLILLDIDLRTGASFREQTHRLQDTLMEGLEHRHYDGVEFIREIGKHHQLTNRAVMPVVFTSALFDDTRETGDNAGGLLEIDNREEIEVVNQTSQVFIDCVVSEVNDSLVISWFYVGDLFEAEVIDSIFEQYIMTLTTVIEGKSDYIPQLNRKHRLLVEEFNRTREDIEAFTTLTRLFSQQAARTSDNTAIESGEEVLTYRQLERRSFQVAYYLRRQGVKPDDLVGVLTPRSIGTIVNVLGILKVGAAYVPIDPGYPGNRRNYILNTSNCKFYLETEPAAVNEIKIEDINQPGDIAYVIYTSGSTGRPKGVVITHGEASNTIIDINRKFCVNENDRIMGISSMCFDLSVYDVFGTLSTGARLVLIATQKDADLLIETLERNRVTLWNSVPALMELVVNNLEHSQINHTLRTVLLSGDWIPIKLPEKIMHYFPEGEVISLGGATEGSIWSIYYPIKEVKDQWKSIPYGYPLVNQEFYLLNFEMAICPPGVAGELYIGGAGVAEGYINDQDKTHISFIYHPTLGRIYKTGDYGIFHSEGFIEFLGRKDQQIKIRGYRVELGEIESCLLECENVEEAVVVQKEKNRNKYLCGYIVAGRAGALDSTPPVSMEEELRTYLSRRLPDYMIPSRIIFLDRLPLNINGKLDRKALPGSGQDTGDTDTIGAPPENTMQQTLLEIWEDVLEIASPGIDDNFFELGGDSLKLMTLVSKIHKRSSIKVPLAEVFNSPTIRQLSAYIAGAEENKFTGVEVVEKKQYYPLSSAQKRLYVLHQMIGHNNVGYNIPMIVELEGELDINRLEDTFVKLIRRHESLRAFILTIDNGPVQGIRPVDNVTFKIEYHKSDHMNPRIQPIIQNFIRPFDLSHAPLFRAGLIKAKRHILMVDVHHIISDRASLNLLIKDFTVFYERKELPPLRIQYRDYAKWQTGEHQKEMIKQQEEYWLKKFTGELPILDIPTDYPRPPLQSFEGDRISFEINSRLTGSIRKLTAETGTTLYIVLMAAYNILLEKYTGQENIIIGTPISGRRHIELEYVIGVFVNMLAISNHPLGDRTFREFLEEVKENAVQAYENQDYPFDHLVRSLGLERVLNSQPLVNIVFQVYMLEESTGMGRTSLSDGNSYIAVTPYNYKISSTKYDLVFEAIEMKDKIKITQEYSTALFKRSTIEKFIGRYIGILEEVVENRHIRLKEIKVSHDWSTVKPDVIDTDFNF